MTTIYVIIMMLSHGIYTDSLRFGDLLGCDNIRPGVVAAYNREHQDNPAMSSECRAKRATP